jgi:hypothetical protein
MVKPTQVWAVGSAYEPYIGRWSRLVARKFLARLAAADGAVWLDVGCGTGALSEAVREMARVARAGARVAAYVWDYAGRMELIRCFWDAAAACDPSAVELDEGRRFRLCQPQPLTRLFEDAGLVEIDTDSIDVPTRFRDFDTTLTSQVTIYGWNTGQSGGRNAAQPVTVNVADATLPLRWPLA